VTVLVGLAIVGGLTSLAMTILWNLRPKGGRRGR